MSSEYNKTAHTTSRVCCLCKKMEYPNADIGNKETWICEACADKLRKLISNEEDEFDSLKAKLEQAKFEMAVSKWHSDVNRLMGRANEVKPD